MHERYLVRCTAAKGYAMAGIYAARLTTTGMVATWKAERAACYETAPAAARIVSELGRKYPGTSWGVVRA